jgi:hypothetical protein
VMSHALCVDIVTPCPLRRCFVLVYPASPTHIAVASIVIVVSSSTSTLSRRDSALALAFSVLFASSSSSCHPLSRRGGMRMETGTGTHRPRCRRARRHHCVIIVEVWGRDGTGMAMAMASSLLRRCCVAIVVAPCWGEDEEIGEGERGDVPSSLSSTSTSRSRRVVVATRLGRGMGLGWDGDGVVVDVSPLRCRRRLYLLGREDGRT